MPQSHLEIYIHFVWATKYRDSFLNINKRRYIFGQIKKIAQEKGYHVLIINGVEDHVHCLIRLRHSQRISKIANDLKGISSRWINKNKFLPFFFEWQNGYGAFSVCPQHVNGIIQYIKNQQHHHKND